MGHLCLGKSVPEPPCLSQLEHHKISTMEISRCTLDHNVERPLFRIGVHNQMNQREIQAISSFIRRLIS
ncbi:hypothetical protein Sjap_002636 [Stephania japonica]|uniref:Uncharacterized protein n=1 Tax=Stephania japonica TaxID=461633 RepID=A0AAP0PWA9_9MAGN